MNFVSRLNPLPPRLWGLLKRMERTGPRRAHRSRAGKISTEKSPKPYADMTGVFLKVKIVFKKTQDSEERTRSDQKGSGTRIVSHQPKET